MFLVFLNRGNTPNGKLCNFFTFQINSSYDQKQKVTPHFWPKKKKIKSSSSSLLYMLLFIFYFRLIITLEVVSCKLIWCNDIDVRDFSLDRQMQSPKSNQAKAVLKLMRCPSWRRKTWKRAAHQSRMPETTATKTLHWHKQEKLRRLSKFLRETKETFLQKSGDMEEDSPREIIKTSLHCNIWRSGRRE